MAQDITTPDSELLIYTTDDGSVRIDVRLIDETVWLTQAQLAELFDRDRSVITKHIGNMFSEGELEEKSVCVKFAHTAADGIAKMDITNMAALTSWPTPAPPRQALPMAK